MIPKNPWLGLASYEEPKNDGTDYEFCGRDEETIEMVRLIDNNLFVTLYGSSGIGKTSLLRAGVIPILRKKDYFPLYVRLSQEPKEISYAEAIVRKLQAFGLTVTKSAEVKHHDTSDRLFLWEYFATTRFLLEGREVYPVIILDQFEEVFREGDKAKAELLLKQIYLLLNDELEMPDETGWSADTNYRFVASIREDFLFVLEDSIDENSLDLYKNNRYRLRPLKPEQARQVVLVPGKECIEETAKEVVAERIIALAKRPQSNDIDTLLLSLVCAGTYDKKSGETITLADLAVWKSNPMEVYYKDAIKGLSASEVRYIQQHFIREDGSRRRMNGSDVKTFLGEATYNQLTQGANRLFTIGDKGQVELLHDQLGLAVYEERKAFEEQERKKKLKQKIVWIGSTIFIFMVAGFFFFQNSKLKKTHWRMMENQARFVAEKASQLVDEGDSYLARMLLTEFMPKNLNRIDKPYTIEAESALRKACLENKTILKGHTDNVNFASFSHDGRWIVSASDDRTVRVWDVQTGILLKTLEGHTDSIKSASFSPNDKWIVSASDDKTIRIWDVETGMQTGILLGHTASVRSAYFSPDGKRIVSASWDHTIRLWDVETAKLIKVIEGHTDVVWSASFSPDGKSIASTSSDNTVKIWDAQTGNLLNILEGHTSTVRSAIFSADCKKIVTVSDDHTVRIWDTQKAVVQQVLKGYTYHVYFASFSPNGKRIVTASYDNIVRIYDAQTGLCLKHLIGHTDEVNSATFSSDCKLIASASIDNTVRIWDAQPELLVKTLEGHTSLLRSASFSTDSKKIVSASFDDNIRVCDVQTGSLLRTLVGHTKRVNSAAFSPDGKRIVSSSDDQTVRIWDAATGHQVGILKGHTNNVNSAFFSPDAKCIVSASSDNSIRTWDVETGKQLYILEGHTFWVKSASFSPDGKRIVSASNDRTVRIWDAATGEQTCILEGHTASVRFASFSPDGKRIVSTSDDKTIRIWDAETGIQIDILEGHTNSVLFASFSPDGKLVVSASSDNTVRVWDVKTGQLMLLLEKHSKPVLSAFFCSDGKRIVSASDNYIVRIWDFPPLQELIDETRERFKDRPLTPEERRKYYLE